MQITNRSMPVITRSNKMLETRSHWTRFLSEPGRRTLPPQMRLRVLWDGKVYLCDAPDGRKIYLPTHYKSEVIASIRYEDGKIFVRLCPATRPNTSKVELFLIKEDNLVYHQGKEVKEASTGQKEYENPEIKVCSGSRANIFAKTQNNAWLAGDVVQPLQFSRLTSQKGTLHFGSYKGEPVTLPLGLKYARKVAFVNPTAEGRKIIHVDVGRDHWKFELVTKETRCFVRVLSEPN